MVIQRVLPALALLGIMAGIALAGEETPPPPPVEAPPAAQQVEAIRQVQIQVWISETTEDGLRDIGTNLDYTRFVRGNENSGSVERISTRVFDPNSFQVTLPAADANPYADNVRLTPDFPASVAQGSTLQGDAITTQSGAGITFSIIDSGTGTIDGIIRGIEQKSDADLISKPELLVVENGTAEIHAGEEIPYQSLIYQKGRAQLQVTWRQVGVNLSIQPVILDDDMIEINLAKLNVVDQLPSSPIRGIDLPVFSTREQTGQVLVPNGQTLVIGGLSTRNVTKTERRIPLVGKMPVLGAPFRGRRVEARNSHLLIFLSPTIVDLRNLRPEAISALNFWREEKWKNLDRIEQEIEIMEDEL
ncbi:MAG TPA: type II and III secretion system protein [Candidatus Hydrogenedentes bacterium]|jgi:type II secretory pathway component GspD/PulD (secretin)|nr:type II and III secretion system protein [Candidatus Hydrogenedentota bacterium]MDY0030895.1 type II and III secretion system protein [FCB group bacterium]NLT59097.1 type II and III secretion system protein [Candidatus Hydrogenedentota bacterium]HNV21821.1 type II and III secretion system protein [Candidatus Hydrogenedentota bacterium]HNZ17931.1 type II and III secretion system protein [Candidatus Hydrogenedentota bacterium]